MNLSARNLYKLAEHYFCNKQFDLSENILNELIKKEGYQTEICELIIKIKKNQNDINGAEKKLQVFCEKKPKNKKYHYELGAVYLTKNNLEKAIQKFNDALNIDPKYFEALHEMGVALNLVGKNKESLEKFTLASLINANSAELNFNTAKNYDDLGEYKKAIEFYEKTNYLDPNYYVSYDNKGQSLRDLNRNHEALIAFDKAIEIDPSFSSAYLNKAFSYLVMGEFKKGWLFYEYRWKTKDPAAYLHPQLPQLKTLEGISDKCILVWAEQGLGDTLQFSRYISLLQDRGADIIFEVQPSLFGLFSSQEWCSVIARGNPFRKPDYQTPLLSLPLLFETDLASIPSCNTVLKTNADRVAKFHKTLSLGKDRLNIGLACSGNSEHKNDRNRTMPLHHIAPLLPLANVFLIQKEVRASDLEFLGDHPEIHFMGAELYDFEDTAAVVQNMDLIISVDTSLAHLAGSLGKKLLVLLPWAPEWRWLLNRQDSPWYPSATLLRQPSMGDWGAVIEKVKEFAKNIVIEK